MLVLRPGRSEDAARLSAIAAAAKAHWGYPPDWLAAWREELTVAPALLASGWERVADRDAEPVGFVAVVDDGGAREIAHLWVLPVAMGQGVGRALVAAVLERAGGGRSRSRPIRTPWRSTNGSASSAAAAYRRRCPAPPIAPWCGWRAERRGRGRPTRLSGCPCSPCPSPAAAFCSPCCGST